MNKPLPVAFSLLLACVFAFLAMPAFAAGTPAYTLSVPLPGGPTIITGGPAQYVSVLYLFALGAGALLAMTMIVFGAIEYTISAGNAGKQGEARDRITNAVYGLTLLLSAYLILYLVNPRLVSLSNPTLPPTPPPAALRRPFPPTNLQVFVMQRPDYDYRIIWRDNADNEDGFTVYGNTVQAVPGGPSGTEILFHYAARPGTGFVPSGATPEEIPLPSWARSRIVSIYVVAYNAADRSPSSVVVIPQIRPLLAAPTNLRVSRVGGLFDFRFEWNDNSTNPNEAEFCLYGRLPGNPDLTSFACAPQGAQTLTVTPDRLRPNPQSPARYNDVFIRAENHSLSQPFSDWSNRVQP